ncbi:MAG: tRNA (N6-isopentenyl adenosine(37)-C2)-methylthiotransferase MiaB [Spirochaetaceae bacterium]|nr:tRNA (N6-isopentenyl adenosine(37)-C2)-methylthiotransferase MiaB [Spirochaetaceae bacterium]
MRRFWLETYGCQMNKAESNALEESLREAGWIAAETGAEADLVILNTCSVRIGAENRIWGRIGHFKALKEKRPHTLVVMGCMAQRLGEELKKTSPAVDMVVGTFRKEAFTRMLEKAAADTTPLVFENETGVQDYVFAPLHARRGDFRAFVPIMHGCDNFCAYCIVPHVRGREVSRPPESIFAEMEKLLERGAREITLLGQNVNSYSFDGRDFPGLLDGIFRRFPEAPWIRFLTSHPKDFSGALIDRMALYPALCRRVHLPVQHGSDTILRRMNRKYTRGDYLERVGALRARLPGVLVSTDILVGFPGETDADFRATLALMEEVRFDEAFTYYYNPREGTAAWGMDNEVPKNIKLERLREVIDLQRTLGAERKKERLGTLVRALAEEVSRKNSEELLGRTEGDEMVVFPGPRRLIGNFCALRLEELRGNTFFAREVTE